MWPSAIWLHSSLLLPSLVDMAAQFDRAVRSLRFLPPRSHALSCSEIEST